MRFKTYLGETGSSRLCRPSSEQCPYISRAACRTPHARSGWQTLRYAPRRLISRHPDSQIHHQKSDPLGAVVCIEVRRLVQGVGPRAHVRTRFVSAETWTNRPCDRWGDRLGRCPQGSRIPGALKVTYHHVVVISVIQAQQSDPSRC